jgi:hypothetical protein
MEWLNNLPWWGKYLIGFGVFSLTLLVGMWLILRRS